MSEQSIIETQKEIRLVLKAACHFGKVTVRQVSDGVKVTCGQVKGTNHMAVHNYIFDRIKFQSAADAKAWYKQHVQRETLTAMDFNVWNEYRKSALAAYLEASHIR